VSTKSKFDSYTSYASVYDDEDIVLDNLNPAQILYGRVNSDNQSMIPLSNQPYKQLTPGDTTIFTLDFVADAFRDLNRKYFELQMDTFGVSSSGNLKPIRAYEDPRTLYREYIDEMFVSFLYHDLDVDEDIVKVKTFDEFVNRFVEYARLQYGVPITFSGFVRSTLCPPHCSGLLIELAKIKHDDMEKKIETSTEIEMDNFASLARKYGFVIPKYAPWCLMANLNSDIMHRYAIEYDVFEKSEIINSYYIECRRYDIDHLKSALVSNYTKFMDLTSTRRIVEACKNDSLRSIMREMPPTEINPSVRYTRRNWISLYLSLLTIESRRKVSKLLLDSIAEDCYYLYSEHSFESMHNYASSKLNLKTGKNKDKFR
jgi:hypothetical protein